MTAPAEGIDPSVPVKPASRWEDFIDILYAPAQVYERRRAQSPWPTIWIITIAFAVITFATFNALEPLFDAEARAEAAKVLAKNPQVSQDMMDRSISMQVKFRKWSGIGFPIGILFSSLLVWVVARIAGTRATLGNALVIATYSAILVILQTLVVGAQALVMDVSQMTTPDQLALGPVRFLDKATTSPVVYYLAKVFDLFALWSLAITSIGVAVVTRSGWNRARVFAAIYLVGSLLIYALIGLRAAAAAGS